MAASKGVGHWPLTMLLYEPAKVWREGQTVDAQECTVVEWSIQLIWSGSGNTVRISTWQEV